MKKWILLLTMACLLAGCGSNAEKDTGAAKQEAVRTSLFQREEKQEAQEEPDKNVTDEVTDTVQQENISDYQARGYVLKCFKDSRSGLAYEAGGDRRTVQLVEEGDKTAQVLAEIDKDGNIYRKYESRNGILHGIYFFAGDTVYFPTENGYVIHAAENDEDITEQFVNPDEKIINIHKTNTGFQIITHKDEDTFDSHKNVISIYDENGTLLFSESDEVLEKEAQGTSMEGEHCNWDFDELYIYSAWDKGVSEMNTIVYDNEDGYSATKFWTNDGKNSVIYVGHVLILLGSKEAYIVPDGIKVANGNGYTISGPIYEGGRGCISNGTVILYENHLYDKSRHDFDWENDLIKGFSDHDTMVFIDEDLLKIKKEDGSLYLYNLEGKKVEDYSYASSIEFRNLFSYHNKKAMFTMADDNGVEFTTLIDKHGNWLFDPVEGSSSEQKLLYFPVNQCYLIHDGEGNYKILYEDGSCADVDIYPANYDEDTYLKARSEMSEQEGIEGPDNGWFEEKGHIYHCYIFENELQKVQVL